MMFRKIISWTLVAMAAGVCPSICAAAAKQSPNSSERGCCPKCSSNTDEPAAPVDDAAGNSCFCCGVAANPTKVDSGSDPQAMALCADLVSDWGLTDALLRSSFELLLVEKPPLHDFGRTLPLII